MDRVRRKIFMKAFDENEMVYRVKDLGWILKTSGKSPVLQESTTQASNIHTAVEVVVSKFHNRCSNITHLTPLPYNRVILSVDHP